MADNPYTNKVVFGDETLIDLTSDTVSAEFLAEGETAHDASGSTIVGTASVTTKPTADDAGKVWTAGSDGTASWKTISSEISDCVIAPSTAEVGQAIVVKAVDENGKPTEWEASDIPSAVTDDHINDLINNALNAIGVAEEGAY